MAKNCRSLAWISELQWWRSGSNSSKMERHMPKGWRIWPWKLQQVSQTHDFRNLLLLQLQFVNDIRSSMAALHDIRQHGRRSSIIWFAASRKLCELNSWLQIFCINQDLYLSSLVPHMKDWTSVLLHFSTNLGNDLCLQGAELFYACWWWCQSSPFCLSTSWHRLMICCAESSSVESSL